ncbi:four-jointed box protein 1 [Denticeps clupeoides]|uniref:Four-jointed box protein 1 n=1 Tax=Denticeps clupeoides TaxID=299321 RepID=A0AAY4B597_9TELE|nr:four-jointed box protein 1 [Denticeps clupeoides]
MRAASSNLLALVFLCTCSGALYVWSRLEERLERHRRGPPPPPDSVPELPAKTFRALLAVPPARSALFNATGGNRPEARPFPRTLGEITEDGVYWSGRLESFLPPGFGEDHGRAWRRRARSSPVVSLEPGCGRVSNQLATFSDGSRACVRYGIDPDQVQGEALSYYLAALLGISNLPPLALSLVGGAGQQWAAVRRRVEGLQWSGRAVVSLTEWVANLTAVATPALLRPESRGLNARQADLENQTAAGLLRLVQWSDLILFDYLTANFDRLASNLFSLQWDAAAMRRDTSNLLQAPGARLVFLDNEAGLVHGYRVLDAWERYHRATLASVCLFRRATARRVAELHRAGDARARLLELYRRREPLHAALGFLSDAQARTLQRRIGALHGHIADCRAKYGRDAGGGV